MIDPKRSGPEKRDKSEWLFQQCSCSRWKMEPRAKSTLRAYAFSDLLTRKPFHLPFKQPKCHFITEQWHQGRNAHYSKGNQSGKDGCQETAHPKCVKLLATNLLPQEACKRQCLHTPVELKLWQTPGSPKGLVLASSLSSSPWVGPTNKHFMLQGYWCWYWCY